jgi:hypothetical protein
MHSVIPLSDRVAYIGWPISTKRSVGWETSYSGPRAAQTMPDDAREGVSGARALEPNARRIVGVETAYFAGTSRRHQR